MSDVPGLVVKLKDGTLVRLTADRQPGSLGFIRVPLNIYDEIGYDRRALGSWLLDKLEAAHAKPRRRPYLPSATWAAILERFGHACAYCGATGVPLQKEHVIPFSEGGRTDETNIVPACVPCNQAKAASTWSVMWP